MKKLIPTLIMSACGLAALGGSSFAWFTVNATVTASTLGISAKTDSSLVIEAGYYTDAEVSTMVHTAATLAGTVTNADAKEVFLSENENHTVDMQRPGAWETQPTVNTAGKGKDWQKVGTISTVTTGKTVYDGVTMEKGEDEQPLVNSYVVNCVVSIARVAQTAGTYSLKIKGAMTFGTSTVELDKAFSIGILNEIGTGEEGEETYFEGHSFSDPSTTAANEYNFAKLEGLENNKVYHFNLMMWLDGENAACYTNAAGNKAENRNGTFTFTAE